ncbi:MAG: hypothetical protein ACKVP3_19735 [Hyphomicrobiaceae bacterium]
MRAVPVPNCKTAFKEDNILPPNDTLICGPDERGTARLMSVVALQNYGNLSYMVRQPFDFADRTGKINFDVNALSAPLGGFVTISITEDPVPATTFREYQNFEPGPTPKNGIMIRFANTCGSENTAAPLNTIVYANHKPTIVKPKLQMLGRGCVNTRPGSLNRFQIQISKDLIEIFGTDFSNDGLAFPALRKIYAASLALNFSRGYVHFEGRNHATMKYGYGPSAVLYWDNIGFDGPVISGDVAYEIPDNSTASAYGNYEGATVRNLGYLLRDGRFGIPAGIYDPTRSVPHLKFQDLDLLGATKAKLTFNISFNICCSAPQPSWGLRFRFNSGAWREHLLSAGELQAMNIVGSNGILAMALDVPLGDLRAGVNTLELLPVNAPMDFPPVIANIDLIISSS